MSAFRLLLQRCAHRGELLSKPPMPRIGVLCCVPHGLDRVVRQRHGRGRLSEIGGEPIQQALGERRDEIAVPQKLRRRHKAGHKRMDLPAEPQRAERQVDRPRVGRAERRDEQVWLRSVAVRCQRRLPDRMIGPSAQPKLVLE